MIKYIISFLLSVLGVFSTAQQSFTIKGYVKDQETNEALIGATVYQNSLQKGTATNEYGFFSFKSLSDSIVLDRITSYNVCYTKLLRLIRPHG